MAMQKCCATCKWWGGYGVDDVADCSRPLPYPAQVAIDDECLSLSIAGDAGGSCACWEKVETEAEG